MLRPRWSPGRSARAAFAVLIGASIISACERAVEDPASVRANELHRRAIDAWLRVQYDSARGLLQAAYAANPANISLALDILSLHAATSNGDASWFDSLAVTVTDPGLAACLARFAAKYRGLKPPVPPPANPSREARVCGFLERRQGHLTNPAEDYELAEALELLRRFPNSTLLTSNAGGDLVRSRRYETVIGEMRRLLRATSNPLVRLNATESLVSALHALGRDAEAAEFERSVVQDPSWAYPGVRAWWGGMMRGHHSMQAAWLRANPAALLAHVDSAGAAGDTMVVNAALAGDLRARVGFGLSSGVTYIDRGRLREGVPLLQTTAARADSLGDIGIRAYAHMRYGRALVKAGRSAEAERVLLNARRLADSSRIPLHQKEVEHNLLHLYESLGRDAQAETAAHGFVRFAEVGIVHATRMMSHRDFAMFLRARGRVSESRRHFDHMLRDIDSLQASWFFAGEFHELSGDLDAARLYYERGFVGGDEPIRSLEGLIRVALATGDTAAARRRAAEHDARRTSAGIPESAPLLPLVMTRAGTRDEARGAFVTARATVRAAGQIAAWASLTAELAALEADAGNFARAIALADSARASATSVGAAELALRARATAAFARHRQSPSARSRDDLIAAARESDRTASLQLRTDIARLAASALDGEGRWHEALGWYARAAAPLDSAATRIAMDPAQAQYRSAQRRVYDEALGTILGHAAAPEAIPAWTEWSTRRKGRAYAVHFPGTVTRAVPAAPAGTAIVDFAVLDSVVAALVITPRARALVRLDATPAAVNAAVSALRMAVDARVGTAIDVGRARYPVQRAHELYRMLLEPLEPLMKGVRRLVIVPDGAIGVVPFDALVVRAPGEGRPEQDAEFLIDRFTVMSGTTVATPWAAAPVRARGVTVITGEGAPAAEGEAQAIAAAVTRGQVVVLRGAEATAGSAMNAARRGGIVHFATHAEANERDPAASFIALAPDGRSNGRLGAAEVSASAITAELVVLSACETAAGRILDGEGVLSLSRGFLKAGARTTIATLWPVGTSAVDFAREFYASLAKSADAPEALRAAKLAMRKAGAPAFAWAPYQLHSGAPAREGPRPLALQR